MHISIYNTQKDLPISSREIRAWVKALITPLKLFSDAIAIHFVDEKEIGALHAAHFKDPSPTDCITFPCDPPNTTPSPSHLGDLFICPKVAQDYAERHRKEVKEELALYVAHGLLHLAGYTDKAPQEKRAMRRAEARCLKLLSQKGMP